MMGKTELKNGMDRMLTGWNKKTTKGMAEYFGEDRNEVIWMNYEPPNEQISFDTAI